jgi:dienelactone hydrolase
MTTSTRTPPRRRQRNAFLLIAALIALAAALAPALLLRVRAARLLLATLETKAGSGLLALHTGTVRTNDERIALPDGSALRSRRYRPAHDDRAPVLALLHGVHPLGIDEPRLERFARALAASGLDVHTPELPELLSLDVGASIVPRIAGCVSALRPQRGQGKLGAIGISFTGGLLLMAAATPQGAASLDYVVAIGSHADVRRVARHYAGEPARGPNGERADGPVDPYGARVLIAAFADALFAAEDVATAREALRQYLAEHYAEARAVAARLSPAGAARMQAVLAPDGRGLRPALAELARAHAPALAALSPAGHLAALRVPTLLLHGAADPIVPSTETAWLAREVPRAALERVLITPALRHAEASGPPSVGDELALVDFVAAILAHSR